MRGGGGGGGVQLLLINKLLRHYKSRTESERKIFREKDLRLEFDRVVDGRLIKVAFERSL